MTDMTVANEILRQLGGRQFIALTGAKNLVGSDDSLAIKIGRNAKGISHVRITLTAMDDYTVEFLKIRNFEVKVAHKSEGIYCDMLQDCFENHTGLYVTLQPRH